MSRYLLTTHADHNPLIVGLRSLGIEVRSVNWPDDNFTLDGCAAFYGNLFGEIKHWVRFPALLNRLRSNEIPYVFWNRDAPWDTGIKKRNKWLIEILKPVDIYFAHSLQNSEMYGRRAHYFPNAAQPSYYESTDLSALRNEGQYLYDVSFFGSTGNRDRNARYRRNFLDQLTQALSRDLLGLRVCFVDTSKKQMSIDDQLTFIRRTKINLNIGAMCDMPNNMSWGLPERVFGIPAAGGFGLTEFRESLPYTFGDGVFPSFGTVDECVVKIREAIHSFHEMRDQAEKLHKIVIEKHTYLHRAREFAEVIGMQP